MNCMVIFQLDPYKSIMPLFTLASQIRVLECVTLYIIINHEFIVMILVGYIKDVVIFIDA